MTITTTNSSVTFSGNGSTTVFPFNFLIPSSSQIQVSVNSGGGNSLVSPSLYTATGFGNATGGFVTYNPNGVPLPIGSTITIQRVLAVVQQTSFINQGGFYPAAVEGGLDYLTMLIQQLYANQTSTGNLFQSSKTTINVQSYGADPTGQTDSTSAIANALNAVPASGGVLYFPAGSYIGSLHVYRSYITICGDGSGVTKLTAPVASSWAAQPTGGTFELGSVALNNSSPAYTSFYIFGITVDGNGANQPVNATDDLHGHGIPITNCSNGYMYDVVAQNCPLNQGFLEIHSSFWKMDIEVVGGGQAYMSGVPAQYPGFDFGGSNIGNIINVVSRNNVAGVRMLQSNYGNTINATIYNAKYNGFIYANEPTAIFPPTPPLDASTTQTSGTSANIVNITIINGCQYVGASFGTYPNNSNFNIVTQGVLGNAVDLAYVSPYQNTFGCDFNINTYQTGGQPLILNGNNCNIKLISTDDGYSQGAFQQSLVTVGATSSGNKLDVTFVQTGLPNATFTASMSGTTTLTVTAMSTGSYGGGGYIAVGQTVVGTGIPANTYIVSQLTGTTGGVGTYQMSASATAVSQTMQTFVSAQYGMNVASGAGYNISTVRKSVTSQGGIANSYSDSNGVNSTNTCNNPGYGGVLASATQLTIPDYGDDFQVSGTSGIGGLSGITWPGRRITLHFQGALTFLDKSTGLSYANVSLQKSQGLKTAAGTMLSLESDGTYWYEISRSQPVEYLSRSIVAATTGGNTTISSYINLYVIKSASTLSTYTITFPPPTDQNGTNLPDGLVINFSATAAITTLTLAGNGNTISGPATTMAVGQALSYVFNLSDTTWYPA